MKKKITLKEVRELRKENNETDRCPACQHYTLTNNRYSISRYRNIKICSDCGKREAFEGDFWGRLK